MFYDLDRHENPTTDDEQSPDDNFGNRKSGQTDKFFEQNQTKNCRNQGVGIEKRDESRSVRPVAITERDANRAKREKNRSKQGKTPFFFGEKLEIIFEIKK